MHSIGAGAHARVLVVDDDLGFVRQATKSLKSLADTRVVTSGAEVLSSVLRWQPDVVVLDMLLDDTDSFALLEDLVCRNPADTPFVLCTINVCSSGVRLFNAAGWPVGVLPRCASSEQMRTTVQRAISARHVPIAVTG